MNLSPATPGPPAAVSRRLDITRTLAPVIRGLGLTRLTRGGLMGFALGAIVGAAILLATHVRPFDLSVPVALFCIAAGVLAGVAWGLVRWPRAPEAARTADLYFGLDDRLTTALELRSSDTPVAQAQGRDAARHIEGLALGRSRGRWLRRSEAGTALVAALLFAASLGLSSQGAPHHAAAAVTTAPTTQRARQAAKLIQRLRAQLHLGLTTGQQQTRAMRALDLALARLRRQLSRSTTTRASLRAISLTQQQLRRLAAGLHPINGKAVAQLNSSLGRYLAKQPSGSKSGASARSMQAMAQALNRLAQSLAHLTPAQRAALARALAKSANANANNGLRSMLRQAASALANGNQQAAQAALQRAAQALARSAGTQAAQSRAAAAAAQLGALKNQLSGAGQPAGQRANLPGSANARTGVPGTGARRGASQGKGAGKDQGKGNGRGVQAGRGQGTGVRAGIRAGRGNGRGTGRGSRGSQGATARSGQGVSGAHGSGGRGRSGVTHRGRNVTVYVPGKRGNGPDITRNGPKGAPQRGQVVPYQRVLGQYARGAHQALDRAALPPSVQAYVRRYFSTISH